MTTISKNHAGVNPNIRKFVSKYIKKLEDEKVKLESLTDIILEEIQSLNEKEINQYLTSIKRLILLSNIKVENRMTLNLVSRILASIVFWEYSCESHGMNMLFDDTSRKAVWKKLSKISDFKQKDIMEIVNTWDSL